ncbi:pilus assembly protein TadG-related protein [Arthrobacter sp. AL12]|uniref:pilus assembly protein TadG-related protein n=1 Tax=Arthrobacter sp. AL12 TaxID=3042241 RepID=UPI00249A2DBF|nr:pilus assembly protein TadG-related protein [Arthrobacter sp. AL12]MDI3211508.1 pilus assembly protein TadG-related protein [Arthrobacter sp. AL12]
MRRLRHRVDKEEGATGVLVAVMMLAMIGAGALAVDVGQIYAERAQLQNAADAGAMAAAQQCHKAGGCSDAQALQWAKEMTGGNSNDGATTVHSVDLSVPNQVTVATSTLNGTNGFLTKMFASALNAPPVTVGARATASMAPPTGGSGFPLAISDKCFNLSTASDTSQVQKISYKPGGTCTGPSGTQIPGGWGWLDQSSPCEATTVMGTNEMGSDPGNNPPTGCAAILDGWKATVLAGGEVNVAFPIFEDATNQGQNGTFSIIGYATFKIWGWKFGNNHQYEFRNTASDPGMTSALACAGGNNRCIIGQFVKFESIDSWTGGGGTGEDLGTVDIKLIK